ncbi:DNA repair helicase, putative, partial [Perkinsus marinus ATCC 50983]
MLDLGLSVTVRVGKLAGYAGVIGGPVRMGDNIPVTLMVMVDSRGLKATADKRHLARFFEVAADQEGVFDKLRDCWWSLVTDEECLGLKPTRAASWNITDAKAVSSPDTESLPSPAADGTENEEVEETEGEMSAQMQEVLKARDGSIEYLARLDLPQMYPPPGVMACDLKPYQAQALGWMMKREWPAECGGLPEEAIELYTDPIDAHHCAVVDKQEVALHPSWAEFPTLDPSTKLYLHASRAEASVEFPGAAPDCLGGILADEMGLGKTIMALSLIATDRWLLDRGVSLQPKTSGKEAVSHCRLSTKATLIVVPLSLLNQWQNEAVEHMGDVETFARALSHAGKPFQYYGNDRIRSPEELVAVAERAGLVMTTYGVVTRDGPDIMKHIRWRRIVLDECHLIKSRVTAISRVVRTCLHGDRLWCLSGTPVQNTLEDLFPIIQ